MNKPQNSATPAHLGLRLFAAIYDTLPLLALWFLATVLALGLTGGALDVHRLADKMVVQSLVLLATVIGLGIMASAQYRTQSHENLILTQNLAQLVAANLQAAVVFDDATTANELLRTIHTMPEISNAMVFRKNATVLAEYRTAQIDQPSPEMAARIKAENDQIV